MSSPAPRGSLFVVSAPSGGGKTSLTLAAIERLQAGGRPIGFSVSYTTRAPRSGEQDGVHYHFVDEARFREMIEAGELLEHAEVFGNRYGTGRGVTEAALEAGRDLVLDIDWQGWHQVRAAAGGDAVGIFILPPSAAELERRLRSRGQDSDEVIAGRMAQARAEMAHCREYDYLIVNDDFDRAVDELDCILRARALRTAAQDARHAGQIAGLLAPEGPKQ